MNADNIYLPRYELSIVRAFAGSTASAYKDYGYDICDFLSKIIKTECFKNFENEHTLYTQGYHCIAGRMLECVTDKIKKHEDRPPFDEDTAYWMGYVLMYWKLSDPDAIKLLSYINFEGLYWAYEALHTQDIKYQLSIIRTDFVNSRSHAISM